MRTFLSASALCFAVLALLAGPGVSLGQAADPLTGTWKTVAIEHGGKKLPEELVAKLPGRMQFDQGKVRVLLGDKVAAEGTYTIDERKSPKTIELSAMSYRGQQAKARVGLFEITEKGQLKIITADKEGEKHPANFDTTATPGADLIIYEKVAE
jgi:uncharacterized protein (TIGR03067 family)